MLAFASERKSPAWSKFRQGKNHIKFALLWTLFSFLINSLSSLGHLKAFCFAPQIFFSLRKIFVSLSYWHHLSLSLSLYFNKSISTKNFPTSLSFPIPGTKRQFPVDTVLLLSGNPQDAPTLAWPSASRFVTGPTCSWAMSQQRSACSNLSAKMLFGAQALLYSLCRHTRRSSRLKRHHSLPLS